jgi:hypothetical protein
MMPVAEGCLNALLMMTVENFLICPLRHTYTNSALEERAIYFAPENINMK